MLSDGDQCLELKELGKPLAVQLGVAGRGCDRSMTQIRLDDPNVLALVDQIITGRMPQHVRVDLEMLKACSLGEFSHHRPDQRSPCTVEAAARFLHWPDGRLVDCCPC